MVFDVAITAGGILPFYLAALGVISRPFQSSFQKLLSLFLMAGVTTFPFFGLRWLGVDQSLLSSLMGPLVALVSLAFAEEFVKSLALYFDRKLARHYSYPLVIGLGFAFFENVSWLLGLDFTLAFVVVAFFRLFMVSTAHAVFTALVAHMLNKGGRHARTLYYLLGILLAGSTHALFNLLHHWGMSYLVVPLLIILILYLHFDQQPQQLSASSKNLPGRSRRMRTLSS